MLIDEEKLKQVLGQNIKSARLEANFTQDTASELSNISINFLRDIEGSRSSVSLINFVNLCKALNTTPNLILRDLFSEHQIKDDNLINQISLLDDYEKNALYLLIQYFLTHRDK